jgi:hypothetical protein
MRSSVIDVYKPYKIITNNVTGCWKAALDIATFCLHTETFYNRIVIFLSSISELEHAQYTKLWSTFAVLTLQFLIKLNKHYYNKFILNVMK